MVFGPQLFRAYLFSLADLQMNNVRAALLLAGCTSKEAEGGSGLWVMVSIWPWPPGLGRWRYVVTALGHPLAAPPFGPHSDKWKRPITLEEVSFHFKAKTKKKRERKKLESQSDWLLTSKSALAPEVRGLSPRSERCCWCRALHARV